MSRPFIQKSFRLANRNQFYFLVIVCSLCQPKIDIKAHVSFISSAQPALLHVNEWSISGVFDSHSRRIIKGSHGFIWCSVSLTSTGVISWTEDMQSNQGLGCKAVFWSIQIGSTCALVLVGDAEALMRQFEAPSAAFLGPVTLGLRNEVVSPVCLQSDGCRPAIMSDERERVEEQALGLLSLGPAALICSASDHSQDSLLQTLTLLCPPARSITWIAFMKKGKCEPWTLPYIGASAYVSRSGSSPETKSSTSVLSKYGILIQLAWCNLNGVKLWNRQKCPLIRSGTVLLNVQRDWIQNKNDQLYYT